MNKDELLDSILDKKELRTLDAGFLDEFMKRAIEKNKKLYDALEKKAFNKKSKEFREFKKLIRKRLREVYGVFATNPLTKKKRQEILSQIKNAVDKDDKDALEDIHEKILKSHISTNERLLTNTVLNSRILEFNGLPKVIADLGCGFNPFTYRQIPGNPQFICTDISKEDMNFIAEALKLEKTRVLAVAADLTKDKDVQNIAKLTKGADWCLLLKLLDSLESKKRGSSKKLLESLDCKMFIISFPVQTISGKKTIQAKRKWFIDIVDMLQGKGINYEEFDIGNEKYIILHKKPQNQIV